MYQVDSGLVTYTFTKVYVREAGSRSDTIRAQFATRRPYRKEAPPCSSYNGICHQEIWTQFLHRHRALILSPFTFCNSE